VITEPQLQLEQEFLRLQSLFQKDTHPSVELRLEKLSMLKQALLRHKTDLVDAAAKDFGQRSSFDTEFADILPTVTQLNHIVSRLSKWMKPKRRPAGLMLFPTKVSVEYKPKGVVGVISPWNYPIQLALLPVATAIAAGNRVMLKLSEFTPAVNQVLKRILIDLSDWCVAIEGEAAVASQFSSLPFAHLFFTGSTPVGKKVMQAAAANLTPVTLELGGKSPVIVTRNACLDTAATSLVFGKTTNAGQICVSPDYVLVESDVAHDLRKKILAVYKQHFSKGCKDTSFTSIINVRQYERLTELLSDAKNHGAQVDSSIESDWQESEHKLGLHLLSGVTDDMKVMQEEIFGPLLPIVEVENLEQAISYIRRRPDPLALYLFSENESEIKRIRRETLSGGMGINECVLHVAAEYAPFGGVGHSGMGQYHDFDGFETFSHKRTVIESHRMNWRTILLLSRKAWFLKPINWLFMR